MNESIQGYFNGIRKIFLKGDYTEYTFRTTFENFVEGLNKNFDLFQEQKRKQKIGAPDFKAFRKGVKVGYIETKDLGKNLDNELGSEQIQKYSNSINNIILTNYNRFILIRDGKEIFDFNLFDVSDLNNSKHSIPQSKAEEFSKMINAFFDYNLETIRTPKELARELSKKAKLLRDISKEQLEEDVNKVKNDENVSSLYDFYYGMKELIKDISIDDCVDAYAQTIVYGLFLAKVNVDGKLIRRTASSYIPKNIGIIKKIFINISGDSLLSNLSWVVEDIIDILNASDIQSILTEIDSRGKKDKDPYIFFYEDFLEIYNPEKKKHLGVYYTPRPVVNFIVNSVNQILKKDFDKQKGFADDDVKVLDPAIGTGTFFWLAFLLALSELKKADLSGLIKDKIENHILKDFYGFEILITPYIISHLKLMGVLKSWFYEFKDDDRVQVYLTNTLEPTETHGLMPFLRELTEESKIANKIKTKEHILAVIGNPPYSVSSSNKSGWIMEKMEDYKKDLKERNIQPLDDDYIKFIRFAQWKIEQNKRGIIGFITNNSYLDGVIHRQMRKELLDAFDRVYILNLHGSIRREQELPTDVSKDQNVFDIQQGVAISLFIKNEEFKEKKIFYTDLFGTRKDKYEWLDRKVVGNVEWKELEPKSPYYFFTLKDLTKTETYEKFISLKDIFNQFNIGTATGKDSYYTAFNKVELEKRFPNKEFIEKYNYRPFDVRFVYYNKKELQRARKEIMKHLKDENLALVSTRFLSMESFQHQFVTDIVSDRCLVSTRTKEGGYIFPLYLFNGIKKPNFTKSFIEFIDKHYPNQKIKPEDILSYIYAVLHSKSYREEFIEFLKIDFPRIPFVKEFRKFKKLSKLGQKLIDIHLMKKNLRYKIKFDVSGSNIVEITKFKDNKVYINREQFFDGISEEAWNFYIGGYQVFKRWLSYRKNRELDGKDIEHFIQIAEIIKQTIKLMEEIDKIEIF